MSAFNADSFSKHLKTAPSESTFSEVLSSQLNSKESQASESVFSRRGSLVEQAIRSRQDPPTEVSRSSFASWLLGL